VLTIGNFDGVHRGHQELVRVACRIAAERPPAPVVAVTFEPHPRLVLTPDYAPQRLTTPQDKLDLLHRYGVDDVIILHSEPSLFQRSASEFIEDLARRCRPFAMVEGASFSFGRGREGSIAMLAQNAKRLAFELKVVDTLICDELPGKPGISSSAIRDAIARGDVAAAEAMLARPHSISGEVGGGADRGASLGIPTANLNDIPQLIPAEAVYAAAAELTDGSLHLAAVNIGPQPTFDSNVCRIEAHLLDFEGDLRGTRLRLHFFERIRRQIRFATADELVGQLHEDIATTAGCAARLESIRTAD
jgi:riboflavin kinase/FMN adenylyltransferase